MDTQEVLARFDRERQALAILDHPNIARVHDAGATERGRPYFVMEYIEGTPLTTFVEEQLPGIEERLELFLPICAAIERMRSAEIPVASAT